MKAYVTEALGTFLLVTALLLSSGNPLAIGLTLMAALYIGAHISGGHFNPAVTLAVWLRSGLNNTWAVGYVLSQTVGALAGAVLFNQLTASMPTIPSVGGELWKLAGIEGLLAFVFVSVILSFLFSPRLKGNDVYGLAIGLTLSALVFVGQALTGAIFNPAVVAGFTAFYAFKTGVVLSTYALVYTVGPLLGGAVAHYVHNYLND